MFFLGLTASLVFVIGGAGLLMKGSYLIGGLIFIFGLYCLIHLIHHYTTRRKRRNQEDLGEGIWLADCSDVRFLKKMDCDCGDAKDCDCSPDCSV